jgi:hypothetical protein
MPAGSPHFIRGPAGGMLCGPELRNAPGRMSDESARCRLYSLWYGSTAILKSRCAPTDVLNQFPAAEVTEFTL